VHTGPENKRLIVEGEEKLVTYIREAIEEVKGLDQEPIEQAIREYRQATRVAQRDRHYDIIYTKYKDILTIHHTELVPYLAKTLTHLTLTDSRAEYVYSEHSIVICCRCRTVESLYDLEMLIASGELDQQFSLIMSCLIREQVTASVTMSHEDFNRSHAAAAG